MCVKDRREIEKERTKGKAVANSKKDFTLSV